MWSVSIFTVILLICQVTAFPRRNFSDDSGEVVSLFVLYRHGDRGPTSSFPNDPYFKPEYWPQGYGELTEEGIRRQYDIGQWLRDRYRNFIPETYSPKDVYVFSTDIDRTLMSASANLAGLFPPTGNQIWNDNIRWQPIPIHTSPSKADEIFPSRSDCSKYDKEYSEVKKTKHFEEIKKKYANLFAALHKSSGMKVDDLRDVRTIRDVIYVYENYNKAYVPSWASEFDRKTLDEATGIYFERKSYTDNLKKYLVGPFYHTLTSFFDQATKNEDHRKLFMVSSHETSLVPVLDAMGAYDFFPPDFGATVVFELRKSASRYYVNIYYKQFDGVKQLAIYDCEASCDYSKFKSVMSKFTLDYEAWKKICNHHDDDDSDDDDSDDDD